MVKVVDSWSSKKVTEDEKQLRIDDVVREEALRLLWHNGSWRHGIGGVHGKDFPFKNEQDIPPRRYSHTEIVNDFTNETDFVKFSDERYVSFLESRVAHLEYALSLKDNEVK